MWGVNIGMYDNTAFTGLKQLDVEKLKQCLNIKTEAFEKGYEILEHIQSNQYVFIIQSGEVNLIRIDFNGNRTILEKLKSGNIFSDIFISDNIADSIFMRCASNCEIMFIDYKKLISPCNNMCSCHLTFLSNLMDMLLKSSAFYNERIDILSRRSIREKLIAYFNLLSNNYQRMSFNIPMTLSELADYLSVDRSAMMREISKMNIEGIIKSERRKITLL